MKSSCFAEEAALAGRKRRKRRRNAADSQATPAHFKHGQLAVCMCARGTSGRLLPRV